MKNIQINRKLQMEFLNNSEKVDIKVDDILLKHKIHKHTSVDVVDELADRLKDKNLNELVNVAVVRKFGDKYSLVTGFKSYALAKKLGIEKLKCIIVNKSRNAYIRDMNGTKENIKVSEIKLNKKFKFVSDWKIQREVDSFMNKGKFTGNIVLDRNDTIIDGYSRLMACKIIGLENIDVIKRN